MATQYICHHRQSSLHPPSYSHPASLFLTPPHLPHTLVLKAFKDSLTFPQYSTPSTHLSPRCSHSTDSFLICPKSRAAFLHMSSSTSTPSSQLSSTTPTSCVQYSEPSRASISSDSEDSKTLPQVVNQLTPALLRIVSQYNDSVRIADTRFPSSTSAPPTKPGHTVADKRLVYEKDPVQMESPQAYNENTPLPSCSTPSTVQTSQNVTVTSEIHKVSENEENVNPENAPDPLLLPVEEENSINSQCGPEDHKNREVGRMLFSSSDTANKTKDHEKEANEIHSAEQEIAREIALVTLIPTEYDSQTSCEVNNSSGKTPRSSSHGDSPPPTAARGGVSHLKHGQRVSCVSSPRGVRIAGKGLVTVMSDTDVEKLDDVSSPTSCTPVPKMFRSSDIGPDARRRGRISRSRRSRFTVPIPFSLMGPILQERTIARIEEQRRMEDEAARKARVFYPRSMPDFSRPSPTPRGP